MKPLHCVIAAFVGYLVIALVAAILMALSYVIGLPYEAHSLMLSLAILTTPIVMGITLGIWWTQPTIAFDEILPTCIATIIIFGVPLLFLPPAIAIYAVISPLFLYELRHGMKIGIELRHHRLLDELLGKWSAGEK